MNQHFQRRTRPTYAERQGRHEEPRKQDQQVDSLDQLAGQTARGIIKNATNVPDTTPIWRALKDAFLAGYDEASR